MPYNPLKDEYFWLGGGYTALPNMDGSSPDGDPRNEFHPEYPSPSFFQAWFELNQHVQDNKTPLDIVIVGKMYRGQTKITGISGRITIGSLLEWAVSRQATEGPFSDEFIAKKLLGLNEEPDKLVGIYFKILD